MEFLDKLKEFVRYYKINLIGGCILLIIIFISNFFIYTFINNKVSNIKIKTINEVETKIEEKEIIEEKEYYYFDIKGAVNNPGVFKLEKGKRIIDAINIAGGLKENANTSVNNLSKSITDEMVIIIYTNEEVLNFNKTKEKEQIESNQCVEYNEEINNDSCIEEEKDIVATEIDVKVSINTGDINLLMTLPGIGESKAKDIIDYREDNGLFNSIEEIMNVSGIGEKLFEKIKDYITT